MLNILENIKYENFIINNHNYHLAIYDINTDKKYTDVALMLHGVDGLSHDFDYLVDELAKKNYRIILIDIFGRGRSSHLQEAKLYNNSFYVDIIKEVINRLKIKEVDLFGTSMGGILAIEMCARFKNMIKRIILNDVGPYIKADKQFRLAKFFNTIQTEFEDYNDCCSFLKDMYQHTGIKGKEQWLHFFKCRTIYRKGKYTLHFDKQIFHTFLKYAEEMKDINLWHYWNKIDDNVKILVLRGNLSPILEKQTLNKMLDKKNCEAHTFPKVSHAPMLSTKDQLDVILNWLD
ncbi:alpha/beta hydrolase [Anaplasmataceae bacterium AB001_6]|nr:alpha/beta hydrolase [Anaplasmataceae bacterium AB001_6]